MRSAAAIGLRPRHCGTAALRGGGPSPLRPALRPAALLRPQRRHRPRLAESSTRAAAATPGAPGGGGNANGGSPGGSAAGSRRPTGDRSPANREPSERVLGLWRSCNAVCFDVDCTVTVNDSLDLLAEFMGVGERVAAVTSRAMDGSMNLEAALEERLRIIDCKPSDIKRFLKAHPPESRIVPGAKELISALQARGVAVYLISGGFREMTLPIARHLGIPPDNVLANRMNWQWDDDTGEPTRLVGFDAAEPTAHNRGKPEAIARLRRSRPYNTIAMVGDGITDLEAVEETGGADLFVGFGGVARRPAVEAGADWYVTDYADLISALKRYRVAMVGSGAWACAALKIVAQNCAADDAADLFEDEVRVWVHEEEYKGSKLSDAINANGENPKYLPGVKLGPNVVADPDLESSVEGADVLVMCAPHQFMRDICKRLAGKVKPGAIAVSLTKGMRVRSDGPQLISQMVRHYLSVDCSVLMGANIAADIGREELSEAVIGYQSLDNAKLLQRLFTAKYFRVSLVNDVAGAEMCGTLKNIVALAAGFVDGLGLGPNTKATIMREGIVEMRAFASALYPTVREETFWAPCGMADLIATCYGGRNRRVAEAFARAATAGEVRSFDQLEEELLGGQKLQGVLTACEVQEILRARGWERDYPLFTTVHRIVTGQEPPRAIVDFLEVGARAPEGPEGLDENGLPLLPRRAAVLSAA